MFRRGGAGGASTFCNISGGRVKAAREAAHVLSWMAGMDGCISWIVACVLVLFARTGLGMVGMLDF